MDLTLGQALFTVVGVLSALGLAWVLKLNRALKQTPPEVLRTSPHRWTDEEIKATYRRIAASPIDWTPRLPPRLDRRYVVTGGCGGVGGQLVLHLLARGQPPEGIRILDLRRPDRPDMRSGPVARVGFARADIASAAETAAAFARPWPTEEVAALPLTVFHTAALIAPGQRSLWTYEASARVNVGGTRNVLEAARAAGATVFVATSSASVALRPVEYWGSPLRRWPRHYWQAVDESDFDRPLRPHAEFFGNYAHTKAVAERLVCGANSPDFRTGAIRPANGIYGSSQNDVVVGHCLRAGSFPSWMPNIIQNCVHGGNVSLAHLLFEAALLSHNHNNNNGDDEKENMPKCAGRPFCVTDDGPPPLFRDFYRLLELTVEPPAPAIRVTYLEPALVLLLAHAVELLDVASSVPAPAPFLRRWLAPLRPRGDLAMLQPTVFTAGTHTPASDAAARRSVADGGLGYRPACATIEGMCQQVADWNREHAASAARPPPPPPPEPQSAGETAVENIRNVGTVPAAVAR